MVSSSDLKYKLMRHVTFNPLLFWISPGLIHVFLYEIKKNSVWYNFYHGTSVSITFYIFEHYQLWMMDSKAQRVFFPKTPQLCVWHTEVRRCYHFKLVSHFQLWFPIWGVLVNRLREWKCEIPSLQQYVLLHRPEQPSITYLTLALSFSMRLKFILSAPIQLKSGVVLLALPLC